MRIGSHPDKDQTALKSIEKYHRVIIIIYIPNLVGYFTDAKRILEINLGSACKTIHSKATITLINNGSCIEIRDFLRAFTVSNNIDKLVEYNPNRGKVDPLIGEIRASYEELITISDFDVLYKKDWIIEVEKIFQRIPACGMVGHMPDPIKYRGFNSTTLLSGLIGRRLKVEKQDFKEELGIFAQSINQTYDSYAREEIMTYSKNGIKTVVGAHHFSATLRKEYIWHVNTKPSGQKMAGNSEYHYVDKPVDQMGCLRLSPIVPVVYHMANKWEPWMELEFNKVTSGNNPESSIPPGKLIKSKISLIPYFLRTKLETLLFRTRLEKFIVKFI
jgi:hypothetical protein